VSAARNKGRADAAAAGPVEDAETSATSEGPPRRGARATRAVETDDVAEAGLGDDPLDGAPRDALIDAFYGPPPNRRSKKKARGRQPLKDGRNFRLVTFSFYEDDVARLDALLQQARQQGRRRASRSQIVRLALRQVDVTKLPDEV
jgi:hypothetical protein